MKVVVAIDSLKGSLSSLEADEAIRSGVLKAIPDAKVVVRPLADGGEGRLDGQTVFGKAPMGVAKIAKKYDKTVLAFAGAVIEDAIACNEHGIDAFFPILRRVQTLQEAMEASNARENMATIVEQVFRLMNERGVR